MRLFRAAAAFCILAGPAWAFDAQGKSDTIGMGLEKCSTWSHYRKDDPKSSSALFLLSWVEGYVSAINEFLPTRSTNIANGLAERGIGLWVDDYCDHHPNDEIDAAATAFIQARLATEFRKP